MSHDDFHGEPVYGLNAPLLEGETILWQGTPSTGKLLRSALHIRLLAAYVVVFATLAFIDTGIGSSAFVVLTGLVGFGLFALFAWGVHKTTVYTLTNQRIIMRIGVALDKYINLPLTQIKAADLKMLSNNHGNIVLRLKGKPKMGYWMLWPHARSLRIFAPQPMLRAIPEAQSVAQMLFTATSALQKVAPQQAASTAPQPAMPEGLPA